MSETNSFGKMTILLVDDRQENLLTLEAVLASSDYDLVKTTSGNEALRYLLDHNPALILMDVQMPDLDGFETASIIKENKRTRGIPIIFITAINKDLKYAHKGYDRGAVDYIYKPFDAHILRSKVAAFVETRRQHDKMSRIVAVQQAATQALTDSSDDLNHAISSVLESICNTCNLDIGIFWKYDKETHKLGFCSRWDNPKFKRDNVKPGLEAGVDSDRASFSVPKDLHLVTSFPVCLQDETFGAFDFFSQKHQADDPELTQVLETVGSQIGQIFRRTEAIHLAHGSEVRKAAILEIAADCIVSMDHQGKITEFNPAAEVTFGRARSEVLGKEVSEIIIPLTLRDAHRAGLQHRLLMKNTVINRRIETLAMHSDGTEFPIELTIIRVPTVEPPIFTAYLRDITERKIAERNAGLLVEASATLSASLNYEVTVSQLAKIVVKYLPDFCAFDVMDDLTGTRSVAVAHLDPGQADLANEFYRKYPSTWETVSEGPGMNQIDKSKLFPLISDEMLMKIAQNPEHLQLMRNMGIKSAMIVPLFSRAKRWGSITLMARDNGHRYTKDHLLVIQELAQRTAVAIENTALYRDAQNAIRSRDEFFSIASHEFKTPITTLKMQLQMIQRGMLSKDGKALPPEKFVKMMGISVKQVDRLARLVDDLLDVVKIQIGKLSFDREELNLSELVKEVVENFSDSLAEGKCSVEFELEPQVSGIWDRTRLEQVLLNLLSNAVKYASGKPIKIAVRNKAGTGELTIRDHGPGIPLEQQDKIFQQFERASSRKNVSGLGLGLFIVKSIVEAHHGTIRIDSRVGYGSTFTIELPVKTVEKGSATHLFKGLGTLVKTDSDMAKST